MKNISKLICFVIIFSSHLGICQSYFQKAFGTIGHSKAFSSVLDWQGGIVTAGYNSVGSPNLPSVMRLNTNGDTLWSKIYGRHNKMGSFYSIIKTNDSCFAMCGDYADTVAATIRPLMTISKIDSNGTNIWYRSFYTGTHTGVPGFGIIQAQDNGYLVSGRGGGDTLFIVKTDEMGNLLWSKKVQFDSLTSLIELVIAQRTLDNGFIFLFIGAYTSNLNDVCLMKIDSVGNKIWAKHYGSIYNDFGKDIVQTNDGDFIVTGFTINAGPNGPDDPFLLKVNEAGDLVWSKRYGLTKNEYGLSVLSLPDGGIVMQGISYYLTTSNHAFNFLIRTDSVGDTIWTKRYNTSTLLHYSKVLQTFDGGYIFSNYSRLPNNLYETLVIKTDSSGFIGNCDEGSISLPSTNFPLQTFNLTANFLPANMLNYFPFNFPDSNITPVIYDLCALTGMNQVNESDISLFPNPFENQITINSSQLVKGETTFTINTISGQEVFNRFVKNYTGTIQLNIGELNTGIYFLKISNGSNLITKKIIKYE
ncbi:MAG: T9SS type A sorting domain-containing protein [Bacteroidia bacterium]